MFTDLIKWNFSKQLLKQDQGPEEYPAIRHFQMVGDTLFILDRKFKEKYLDK